MTRLGVVSDSHGTAFWLERYLELCRREKYDAVFHLGDYCDDARWLERRLETPVFSVAGNCDMFSSQQRMARVAYGPHRLLAVHGHMQDVKYGYERLSYYAEENGATIALFGHTHRAYAGWMGAVMLMNPGALTDGCYGELILDGSRATPYLKWLRDGK